MESIIKVVAFKLIISGPCEIRFSNRIFGNLNQTFRKTGVNSKYLNLKILEYHNITLHSDIASCLFHTPIFVEPTNR